MTNRYEYRCRVACLALLGVIVSDLISGGAIGNSFQYEWKSRAIDSLSSRCHMSTHSSSDSHPYQVLMKHDVH